MIESPIAFAVTVKTLGDFETTLTISGFSFDVSGTTNGHTSSIVSP